MKEVNAMKRLNELGWMYIPENYYLLQEYVEERTLRYFKKSVENDMDEYIKVIWQLADIAVIFYLDFNITLVDYALIWGKGIISSRDGVIQFIFKNKPDIELFF